MTSRYKRFLPVLCVLCVPVVSPASDEAVDDGETIRCINSRTIRSTDVINDSNVVFHMQGRKIYLNTLPRSCRGLSRERRFSFVTHTRSLCESDRISVLKDSGLGVYEGRSCKLGRFQLATEQDIADFYKQLHPIPEPKPVDPPPVQDVMSDEADDDDPG